MTCVSGPSRRWDRVLASCQAYVCIRFHVSVYGRFRSVLAALSIFCIVAFGLLPWRFCQPFKRFSDHSWQYEGLLEIPILIFDVLLSPVVAVALLTFWRWGELWEEFKSSSSESSAYSIDFRLKLVQTAIVAIPDLICGALAVVCMVHLRLALSHACWLLLSGDVVTLNLCVDVESDVCRTPQATLWRALPLYRKLRESNGFHSIVLQELIVLMLDSFIVLPCLLFGICTMRVRFTFIVGST
jgi:hypothetical protein